MLYSGRIRTIYMYATCRLTIDNKKAALWHGEKRDAIVNVDTYRIFNNKSIMERFMKAYAKHSNLA